jgi:hypothetical protein
VISGSAGIVITCLRCNGEARDVMVVSTGLCSLRLGGGLARSLHRGDAEVAEFTRRTF